MKTWSLFGHPFILAVIFPIALSAAIPAVENPAGSPTVPHSSIRSGLVRSPNPIDPTSSLVVTGNVSGGKHFRGVVPYNAVSDFRGTLYSTSLDSFLRRSAGSTAFGRYTGRTTPYYSHTGTVTTTRPGRFAVVRGPAAQIRRDTAAEYDLPTPLEADLLLSDQSISVYDVPFRPMSMTLQELEKIIPRRQDIYQPEDEEPTYWQQEQESDVRRFGRQLEPTDDRIAELRKDLIVRQRLSPASEYKLLGEDAGRRLEMQAAQEQDDEDEQIDVYEQMRRLLEDWEKDFEQSTEHLTASPVRQETKDTEAERQETEPGAKATGDYPLGLRSDLRPQTSDLRPQTSDSLQGLSKADLSTRGKAILGKHKTFASFSRDKFNAHVRAAEAYMKQGEYYWAADAYTLASIYKRRDPLVYAGKSYALFAAGEYMSSALFLSRALEIFPEYARFDIDVVAIIGDRDKVESRIVDIEQWLKKSNVGELHFLLGYVYYRLGRLEPAKKAVNAAYQKMPDSAAVAILKKAIDQANQ